jgi:DNA-directed RNA polymerase subunit L
MSEVRLEPIVTEDTDGDLVITFTEDHTIRDILRYMLSTGVEASELIYHINDPTLLAELEGGE